MSNRWRFRKEIFEDWRCTRKAALHIDYLLIEAGVIYLTILIFVASFEHLNFLTHPCKRGSSSV